MRLENQVVLITGGCGDIGRATAGRLSREGATIVLSDVLPEADGATIVRDVIGLIGASGRPDNTGDTRGRYVQCDVSRRGDVDRLFAQIPHVDVVISNAGIVRAAPFVDLTDQDWHSTIAVNLHGAFNVGQAAARAMLRQPVGASGVRGRILFTGSWVQDMPFPGSGAYIASKGGQKMLAKVMAQELAASGILVNLVAPGLVMAGLTKQLYDADPEFQVRATQAVPLGTFQSPENVAGSFAFLCSSDADYMTGATILIDGGNSLVRRD